MSVLYATGYRDASLKDIYQLQDDATGVIWSDYHGASVRCVVSDSDGNVYTGGDVSSSITTRKYNSAGTLQWSANHGAAVRAIAVDSSGNVATGGDVASSNTTRKYDSDGTLLWSVNHGDSVRAVCFDSSGNLYTAGDFVSSVTVRKYNSAGTVQWSRNYGVGAQQNAIAVDGSNNIYVGGGRASSATTRKYNSSGTLQWAKDHGGTVYGIARDSSGNLYASGDSISGIAVRKYNSSGTEITTGWPGSHTGILYCLTISADDDVYVGGQVDSGDGYNVRKYLADGTAVWGRTVAFSYALGLAVFEPLPIVSIAPGLPLALNLAIPIPAFSFLSPGLPLALHLAVPTVTDLIPPIGDGQRIYRAYLALETPLLIPLHSIQCRRRQNDSTWLSVKTAGSAALLTLLDTAISAGQLLIINSGIRDSNGVETIGEFLRAIVTDYAYTKTPGGYVVTIEARVQAVLETLQTRVMTGVSSYQNEDGRRKIRCDVNPVLRPGDTVDTGNGTFIAHNIAYLISPQTAYMDVQEPPLG